MDLWEEVDRIRQMTKWNKDEVELLIYFIEVLADMYAETSEYLDEAEDEIEYLQGRLEVFKQAYRLKLVRENRKSST